MVGQPERHAADDPERRRQGDGIGRRPPRGCHRADDIRFRPLETDIDDVAGNALGGEGARAEAGEAGLMLVVALGERGEEIGEQDIGRDSRDGGQGQAPVEHFCGHRRDFGGRFA